MPSHHHSHPNETPQNRNHRRLHIDTSFGLGKGTRDIAPQASPSAKPQPSPHSSAPRPTHYPNESFLDNHTPVDATMAEQHVSRALQRDSHDLSLSPRNVTRDSLVTNMLLSLDQFSQGPSTASAPTYEDDDDSPRFFDIPRYRSNNNLTTQANNNWHQQQAQNQNQSQGQGHGYSYSSDFEGFDDDSSRLSNQYSRGRRSNSSTNFPDAYSRLNGNGRPPPSSRGAHIRGTRGSKSSSIASAEQAQAQAQAQANGDGPRWNRAFSRSASFDHGPPPTKHPAQAYPQLEDVPQSPFRNDFLNSFLADDFDAAPTPTVPGGPRKTPSTPSIPRPPPEPADRPPLSRNQSSTRSLKSSSGRSKAANTREAAPPMPTTPAVADPESAPAPNVGYGKSKEPPRTAQAAPAPSTATPQPKERPGFFKRVFGGGSKNTPSPTAESHRSSKINTVEPPSTESPSAKMQPSQPSKARSAPPSRDTTTAHSNHPPLQKKTSSFFRRRKKSVADEAPPVPSPADVPDVPPVPPVAPINLNAEKDKSIPQAEPSPVSSLRQVMIPYLRENNISPATSGGKSPSALADITNTVLDRDETRPEEYKREFSPDYEPSPNARIRKVNSNLDREREREAGETPTKRSADVESRNNSFLNLDPGSDNDEEPTPRKIANQAVKDARNDALRPKKKNSSNKLPLQTHDSPRTSNLTLPLEGAKSRRSTSPSSPKPSTPNVRVDPAVDEPGSKVGTPNPMKDKPLDEPEFVIGEPTEDDRQKAQKIFDGNEDFIQKEKAAAWMGEEGPVRQRTLQAYMELYDFSNHSVVASLRQVCGRLVFRAETQQVDRILVAFSKRWCDCNPNHGFKATDVIHTICYSIMLLNTDLHMADIEQKMTRSQFVKNTMGTITQAVLEAAPNAFDRRTSILPDRNPMLGAEEPTSPTVEERKSFRNSFRPPPRLETFGGAVENVDDCGPLVKTPYSGSMKGWEEQVEIVLKAIYASIRDERLPLFGADPKPIPTAPSQSSLSVMGMLKRSPSVLSKAPSEGNLSVRGRVTESRGTASRWTSKSRSRPGIGRAGFNSSRTSFDDGHSVWSPTLSSATWSRQSLGRTQTSMSQDSFGSALPRGDYQQSIGFANALSQAIIRDEDSYGNETAPSILSADIPATSLLEDETLEITGPPWVKEGMVIHKHHLDGVDKKAKERNWSEVFAVIQKGQLSMFSFNTNKSTRQKSRSRAAGPVGGGNWQDNATNLGTFSLRQTLASALPPPGYSRTRPHVWALSLPTGAVHLFQVGTPELIKEFVTTANYWSARLSTHPLTGGVSNIEYGWSDAIVNNALVSAINEDGKSKDGRTSRPGSAAAHGRKSSVGSFRSASIDQAAAALTKATGGGKLPGDRIHIAEWAPPTQSLRPSNAPEAEQLETLQAYVKSIEDELQLHNQLRSPMLLAFTPRGHNAGKAMANWERKSAYLLREIVKFRTYVDCLQQAESRKQEIYAERDLAQRAARGELTDGDMEVSGGEEGDETLRP